MTLDQVHKAANEGDRDALLLATARKDWRSKQSVDLAEELAIADSMHAEDGKGKGGGASSTKQATIKTHRVAYYSSTRIMGMEVEFDGGDAFPKKRD
uniref:Uncharacterized protein n=1 Tax=Prymnesium polylepis TaxID=72548 RepID=A0A7S4ITH2_9EUKA